MKYNLKYHSWEDITLAKYDDICNVVNDKDIEEIDKNVQLVSLLYEEDEDKIWELTMTELQELLEQTLWISEFTFDRKRKFKNIIISGTKYIVSQDISKLSVAQYIDYQNYFTTSLDSKKIAKLLSVLIIPEGKQYNTDYDLEDVRRDIYENLNLPTAQSLLFFFMKKSANSIRNMLQSLEVQMRVMKMITKNQIQKDKLKMMIEEVKQVKQTFTVG